MGMVLVMLMGMMMIFGYECFWGSVTREAPRILLRRSVTEVLVTQVCNGTNIS